VRLPLRPSRWQLVIVLGGAALLLAGAGYWVRTTQPPDPLRSGVGLGIEGSGVGDVPIGKSVAFVWYLIGRNAGSHAVVTSATLPHIPGLRLQLRTVAGRPHGAGVTGPLDQTTADPQGVSLSQLRPLVGAPLRLAPPEFSRPLTTALTIALLATPTRPGCYTISGPLAISYSTGDSTFSRSLDGTDSVSTPGHACPGG